MKVTNALMAIATLSAIYKVSSYQNKHLRERQLDVPHPIIKDENHEFEPKNAVINIFNTQTNENHPTTQTSTRIPNLRHTKHLASSESKPKSEKMNTTLLVTIIVLPIVCCTMPLAFCCLACIGTCQHIRESSRANNNSGNQQSRSPNRKEHSIENQESRSTNQVNYVDHIEPRIDTTTELTSESTNNDNFLTINGQSIFEEKL